MWLLVPNFESNKYICLINYRFCAWFPKIWLQKVIERSNLHLKYVLFTPILSSLDIIDWQRRDSICSILFYSVKCKKLVISRAWKMPRSPRSGHWFTTYSVLPPVQKCWRVYHFLYNFSTLIYTFQTRVRLTRVFARRGSTVLQLCMGARQVYYTCIRL